jgi:hypothetical protein
MNRVDSNIGIKLAVLGMLLMPLLIILAAIGIIRLRRFF